MPISVRLVMPGDFDAVLSLARQSVQEVYPHLQFRPDYTAEVFEGAVQEGNPLGLVAVQDHALSGFLTARIHGFAFATGIFTDLEVLYVKPENRGSQVAVKLLREYLQWATEDVDADEIHLGISSGINPLRTGALYEFLGAQKVGANYRIRRS